MLGQLVDGNDSGMVEMRGGHGLMFEAGLEVTVQAELQGQEFEDDRPTKAQVLRPVDFAHAPFTQSFEYPKVQNLSAYHFPTECAMCVFSSMVTFHIRSRARVVARCRGVTMVREIT